MSGIGGPKNPARSPALQRFLDAQKAKSEGTEARKTGPGTEAPQTVADQFGGGPALGTPQVAGGLAGGPVAGQGALSVRLSTMTGTADVPATAQTQGPRVREGSGGRILTGDITASQASDLALFDGVVRLEGHLALEESLLQSGDLEALSHLKQVAGGLSLEGNAELSALDALSRLEQVSGNLYLGFNDGLERVALPKLQQVAGALIIEGNAALAALELPGLSAVGGYMHLHENEMLEQVMLAALSEVGGELSILDNPKLVAIDMKALARLGGDIEIVDNGAAQLRGLPLLS
jgi:hypothetical protein